MNAIPSTVRSAISSSVTCMVAPFAIPQDRVDEGLLALFRELEGRSASALTNQGPFDRVLSRAQAASLLNCSCITISRHVRDGRLRGIFAGRDGKRLTGISGESLRILLGQRKDKES